MSSQPADSRSIALVITGAPRTGVGLLARILAANGLTADDGLQASDAVKAIYIAAGRYPDDAFGFADSRQIGESSPARDAAGALLGAQAAPFALAAPNLSFLTPLLAGAAKNAGLSSRAIVLVRDPFAAAASMRDRDGVLMAEGLLLWLNHVCAAERDTRGQSRLFVSYDAIRVDWKGQLDRIERGLGVALPRRTASAELETDRLFSPPRSAPGARANAPSPLERAAIDVHEALQRAAANGADIAAAPLDAAGALIIETAASFGSILAERQARVRESAARLAETQALVEQTEAALANRERQIRAERAGAKLTSQDMRRQYEAEVERLNDEVRRAAEDGRIAIERLTDDNRKAAEDGRIAIERLTDDNRKAAEDTHRHMIERTDALLKEQRLAYEADTMARDEAARNLLEQNLSAMRSSTSWRLTAPMRAISRVVAGSLARRAPVAPPEQPAAAPAPSLPSARTLAQFVQDEYSERRWVEWLARHLETYQLRYDAEDGGAAKTTISDEAFYILAEATRERGAKVAALADKIDVSIIVPAYNQISFTLSAIAAIYAQETELSYEIILADDCSSDQTRLVPGLSLPRANAVKTEKNSGFLLNCNHAARRARGDYIVLLNNDTIVLPGWLDALIATLKRDPEIGLVGSRLIFPDGRLQEAGGIVWRDGSAWNFGRLGDPQHPDFAYAREVDFCSGASLAIRTADWRRLGGFDGARYENAYYEDVDLAFRVRENGQKMVYQPASSLVHFEGVSSGTDTGQGIKAYQTINAGHFFDRWKDVLANHRPNGEAPEREKERRVAKRMLIIDDVTPRVDRDAGSVVAINLGRALQAAGWKLSLIPEHNFARLAETKLLQQEGVEAIYRPFVNSVEEYLAAHGALLDCVMIYRVRNTRFIESVRQYAPQAKIIFNTVDLHFVREQRQAALGAKNASTPDDVAELERTELSAVAACDLTIVHSSYEAKLLRDRVAGAKVYTLPWIAEVDRAAAGVPYDARRGIVFLGGFGHPPNADAVHWFVHQIWPRVRTQAPDMKFIIIGANTGPEIMALDGRDGVSVIGWVPEVAPVLSRARLSVVPLRFGAGVKGKVISSVSCGAPVVSTSVGIEGIGLTDGADALVADEPAAFADAVVRLYNDVDLWQRLSKAGADFIDANFAAARTRERIAEMTALLGLDGY